MHEEHVWAAVLESGSECESVERLALRDAERNKEAVSSWLG